MTPPAALARGGQEFERRKWPAAYELLRGAQEPEDLMLLAVAAQLAGHDEAGVDHLHRAHNTFLKRGDAQSAIRAGANLAMLLTNRGDVAQAAGWIARCRRMLDDLNGAGAEAGYLQFPSPLQALCMADIARATSMFHEVMQVAERFEDADLGAMRRLGRGQSFLMTGDIAAGLELFDEN